MPIETTPAILRRDPVSRITWLEFDGRPDDETRAQLKRDGWRWSGYRKQWYNNRRFITPPAGLVVEDAGECDYASERADRLQARAETHAARSTAAYERSNAAVAMIPFGQPILVGHHSERMHRAALKRSHAAMDKSVSEAKTADRLQHTAERSRRHQMHTQTPEQMTRRADRLEAELRKMQRHHEPRMAELRARGEEPTEHDHEYARRISAIAGEVADLRAAIAEAGGIRADQLAAEVGDLVKIHGFTGIIQRVNPKTYTVAIRDGWPLKLEKSWLTEIIARREEIESNREEEEAQRQYNAGFRPCVWCDGQTRNTSQVCDRCEARDDNAL